MRTRSCTVILGVALACAAARAGDAPDDRTRAVAEAERTALEHAAACDARVDADDPKGWARARTAFLDGLAASVQALESASAQDLTTAPEVSEPARARAVLAARLAFVRAAYTTRTLRAFTHVDATASAEAFQRLRRDPSLARRLLTKSATEPCFAEADPARPGIEDAVARLRALLRCYLEDGAGVTKPWPPFDGKRFVLWVVAAGRIDRRDEQQLQMLFSPADRVHGWATSGGVAAYAALDREVLRDPNARLDHLTSYVGRRNATAGVRLTPDDLAAGAPAIADLQFPDCAIVGFVSGEVRVLTRADLGLGPTDPIVAGDASRSPLLRALGE